MRDCFIKALLTVSLLALFCSKSLAMEEIRVATCADYPPFESSENGEFVGFDIDIAQLIGKKLNKKIVFMNMPFASIILAVQNGSATMGLSTITATPKRRENADFSRPYYVGQLAVIYQIGENISEKQLKGKKIACQMGSTMQDWVKTHVSEAELILMDNNNQVVEAIRSGHADFGVMDAYQAKSFCAKTGLKWNALASSDEGYAVAFKKGSPLKEAVDKALEELTAEGEIQRLEEKWSLSLSRP